MAKVGIYTDVEGRFFAKVVANQIPVSGISKTAIKLVLPMLMNGVDNKVGDKIPEPWQSHAENLTTKAYEVFQDGVITDEEREGTITLCAEILNQEIDVPLIDEADEALLFITLLQVIAGAVLGAIKK